MVPFALGLYLPQNALFYVSREGAVSNKHSEIRDKPHFQRHRCPGPDFKAEKGKKGLFSNYFLVEMAFFHFSALGKNGKTWEKRGQEKNLFIAVGDNGTILTSPNGTTWTDVSPTYTNALYGIAYGNNQFAAVGSNGIILTSPDGSNWTKRSSGTTQTLREITYGDNRFVAVGDNSTIVTGTGGSDWVKRTVSITADLFNAAYGNSTFVIVGEEGKILTGSGTGSWNQRASKVRNNLYGVAYGNLQFAAVGEGTILYSTCTSEAASSSLDSTKGYEVEDYTFREKPGEFEEDRNDDKKPAIRLMSPNGHEILYAGEKFLITWESDPNIEKVRLEYSPDNGTTYLPIAVDVTNTGHYEWVVPHHITSHYLVRVSEVKERKMPPHGLVYELDFRVNGVEFSGSGDSFTIYLGDAADETIKNNLPGVSFSHETNGKVYVRLNDHAKEIGRFTGFNEKWHNVQIFMDNVYDRISVILDGVLVFESILRWPIVYFSPALSFSVGPDNASHIEIDDVSVSAFYSLEEKNQWITLFNDDFQWLKEKNDFGSSGWKIIGKQVLKSNQLESGLKTLSIQPAEDEKVTVVKTFNIPVDFPFDISDKPFEIRYNDTMDKYMGSIEPMEDETGHGPYGGAAFTNTNTSNTMQTQMFSRTQSSGMIDTYYIYSHDGTLLAEYDHNGNCVRDYIYTGNRLIAEYKPQTNTYYYYMSDQINTTRIITDGNGNVVYSALYGPYGDVQKVWTNTYDPKLKFSGKEREGYSDLDYFGARYYDHNSYRFISVDPIINKEEALSNPQLWNLYAYCRNNPITYFDPDGRESILKKLKKIVDPVVPKGMMPNIMRMKGWEKNRQDIDKKVEKAVQITIIVGGAVVIIDMVAGETTGGGGKKATDSTKGMPHGDGGRELKKTEKQIEELEEQLKTATGTERKKIKSKIQRIKKSAKKKKKGTTHWRK